MTQAGEGKVNKLQRFLANYPLTFYFGLVALGAAVLLGWLHFHYHWEIDVRQFTMWINRNAELLLIIVTALLSLTLLLSAIAYRQTCRLSREDYYLWLQQRATRTFFPFFTPLHDWLRLHVSFYRWWHAQVYSTTINTLLLLFFVTVSFTSVQSVFSPFPGSPTCSGGEGSITISSNTTWSANACYDAITVNTNATLTINGGVSIQANTLTLGNGGSSPSPTPNGFIVFKYDTLNDLGVSVKVTGDITVNSGSSITGNGWGYVGGTLGSVNGSGTGGGVATPATGINSYAGGGGYGGTGGTVNGGMGGVTYGNDTTADVAGSGGGYAIVSGSGSNGGAGGAAIKLESTGTFTINGTVAANGSNSSGGGGGAGGSLWLIANTFSGSGTVQANGGNGGTNGGGGGGGRIVRRYTTAIGSSLTLSATKGTSGTSAQDGTIKNIGPVTNYTVSYLSPGAPVVTAGTAFSISVTAKDANGITVPNYTGTIGFSSTDGQAVLPANYTFVGADAGVKTFSGLILKTAGTKTVTVTEVGNGAVIGTLSLTVTPVAADHLTVKGWPDTMPADNGFTLTVTAYDIYENIATGYTGTVSFSSTDSQAILPATYTYVAKDEGTKTFGKFVLRTAGTQRITVQDQGASFSDEGKITVTPATASQLLLANVPNPVTAGQRFSPTVTLKDPYGNITTTYTGKIRFTATDPNALVPSDYTFTTDDAGVKVFANLVELRTVGSITLSVTEVASASSPAIISPLTAQTTVTVNPGTLAAYRITTTTPQKIGVGWQETITPLDAYGNTVAVSQLTLLTITGTNGVKAYTDNSYQTELNHLALSSRSLTIFVKAANSGDVTITVTDQQGISATTGIINVAAAEAVQAPAPPPDTTAAIPAVPTTPLGQVIETIQRTVGQTSRAVKQTLDNNLTIVNAANAAAIAVSPVATAVALGPLSTALVTAIIDTLVKGASFLGGMFGITPARLRGRRWGTVRSRRSGLPIGGVFVELIDATGKAIDRVMTDTTGHYAFLVDKPGRYWLQIKNPLYERYLSRPITITNPREDIINENILLELIEARLQNRVMIVSWLFKLIRFLSILHWPLLIFGSLLALYVYSIDPTLLKALVVSLYVLLWGTKILELDYRRPYGVVLDAKTGQPQPLSVVQIVQTDVKDGPPSVRSTMTDAQGRFLFVIKPGRYHLIAGKEGFEPVEMEIQGEAVNLTIKLKASGSP